MTPFLNIPFLPENKYIEFINTNSTYIDSVHFSLMGAKRLDNRVDPKSIDNLDTIIGMMKEVKVENKYLLLNSIFYGPDLLTNNKHLAHLIDCLDQAVNADIVKGIIYCDQFLLQSLSSEAPDLAKTLEAIPGTNTMLDSQAKISSHLAYIGETNFRLPSKLTLDRSLNRNLEKLTDTVQWCRKGYPEIKIELLANEGCLPFCPYRNSHDAYIALGNHEGDDNSSHINNKFGCRQLLDKKPYKLLQSPFIRPEDVDSYLTQADLILLSGRAQGIEFLQKIISAYIAGNYKGNLLELLDSMNWLSQQLYIENSALSFDFANMLSVCDHRCKSCGFCMELFSAIVRPVDGKNATDPQTETAAQ
jgi:collagenase-like PrtC family protease